MSVFVRSIGLVLCFGGILIIFFINGFKWKVILEVCFKFVVCKKKNIFKVFYMNKFIKWFESKYLL